MMKLYVMMACVAVVAVSVNLGLVLGDGVGHRMRHSVDKSHMSLAHFHPSSAGSSDKGNGMQVQSYCSGACSSYSCPPSGGDPSSTACCVIGSDCASQAFCYNPTTQKCCPTGIGSSPTCSCCGNYCCLSGYYCYEGTTCQACPSGCATCSNDGTCTSYSSSGGNTNCAPGCSACTTYSYCTACLPGYSLASDYTCQPATSPCQPIATIINQLINATSQCGTCNASELREAICDVQY